MITTPKWVGVAALALVAAITLAGCSTATPSTGSTPGAKPSGAITVYNAQHEELTQAWADEFTKQTGVTVTLRNGDDSELGNQLVQEGNASPADVFLTENSPAMSLVDNAKLFAPVDAATLAQVPEAYRPSSGHWTGIAARSTVFVYNPSMLSESQLPASLLDLADAKWKGRWAASPSGADFQAIVSALLALKGEKATSAWLASMKENATAYKGNSAVMKAVNAGEIPAGVIYHYYWFGDQSGTGENSDNTKLHYFKNSDPGAFVSTSGGGVLKTAKNPVAAQAFLKFITGKTGQTILQTGSSFEYPVASDVAANKALVPLVDLDAPVLDPSKLDSRKVTDLMTAAGLL
ncbi:iron ABC transporter substrate-binding protein [Lacisediminihabitans sp. H27-G8]|uniref:iron ABC transporter substrate-binding protein n=1 Tax=Lacisediminihabitans sp. H27-G8 TaxID=3111909 RepID=UPI0038FCF1A0